MNSARIPRLCMKSCGILAFPMRRLVLVLALLLANTISAATQFKYVTESAGDRPASKSAGTIRIDGVSYRIDYENYLVATASFSIDGGKTVTALNENLSTYYRLKDSSTRPSSSFFMGKFSDAEVTVKDVSLTEELTNERIAGFATKKYVLKLAHDVTLTLGGHKVRVFYRSTVLLWTTEEVDLSVYPMDLRELHTGFGEVDRKVREALAGVKGFPLKRRMSVTRQYEGGVVMVQAVTTTFDDFKTVDLPPKALAVPPGYRYEEPVIGAPGG
jgi:hypothetical protein